MIPILVKGDDVGSETKVNARQSQLWQAVHPQSNMLVMEVKINTTRH